MVRRILLLFLLLCSFSAKASFIFSANCIAAYNNIMDLKLGAARTLIAAEKKVNPENAIPYLLDNYVDYFDLLTSENQADFERLEKNKSARLSRIEDESRNSPYYLYSIAEINLQWALIRSNFEQYTTAGLEIRKAYNALQENAKKYPTFLPNQKGLGMINAIVGSMPGGLKSIMSFFGVKGDTKTGVRMLENLVTSLPKSPYAHFFDESVFYLSYIQTDILKDPAIYKDIVRNTEQMGSSSLLRSYVRGYAALKMGFTAEAITALSSLPKGSAYEPYPYLEYLLGIAYIHKLDKDASLHLLNFIKTYKGVNHIKDAYLNLAWLELINGDNAGYNQYISLVKSKGYTFHEKDKQALKEAGYGLPNVDLLRARLLFDGGYYDKALAELSDKRVDDFKNQHDKIEYYYRMGRIYDSGGKDDVAIKFYNLAIMIGRNEKYYFAANSALNIGMIYEKQKNYPQAKSFYNTAIGMKNHDYENSIENKAKEGLKRIGS